MMAFYTLENYDKQRKGTDFTVTAQYDNETVAGDSGRFVIHSSNSDTEMAKCVHL